MTIKESKRYKVFPTYVYNGLIDDPPINFKKFEELPFLQFKFFFISSNVFRILIPLSFLS